MLGGAVGLGFANLAVLIVNQFIFRDRPIAGSELTNLLYAATDSSFPSNPAAVAFAAAMAIWLGNRRGLGPGLCPGHYLVPHALAERPILSHRYPGRSGHRHIRELADRRGPAPY